MSGQFMKRRDFLKSATAAGISVGSVRLCRAAENGKPNILWLTCEDSNITWIGCYGSKQATTPNIDKLAAEGFRYTNCFANAPVCAPSRSTWITGIHALSMGTHPMRSRYNIPHDRIKYYPDCLRARGYYCTNHKKTDYNIGGRNDVDCWNSGDKFGWQKRAEGQPFFSVINNTESHESKAFGDVENTKHKPDDVVLRKYHPDLLDIRKNYAHYQDAVERMDSNIGEALAQLEKDGLADDTIVFFCSDHGGVLPRSKRFLFESGIHSPFIARIPDKYKALWPAEKPGMTVDRLVSFIDMPKTWLSLAGAEIPGTMQGKIFLGPGAEPEREYHFSFRGRMDERYDNTRAVRGKRYLYIKNYMPYVPCGQHIEYLWRMVATRAWEEHYKAGKTDEITGRFFKPKPHVEELYDTMSDPDNIKNLASDPAHAEILLSMRSALRDWQLSVFDSGLMPENDVVKRAEQNSVTIYDMVRDSKMYDLKTYMDAADKALLKEPGNEKLLVKFTGDKDSAVRFWGVIGLLLLEKISRKSLKALKAVLDDESHEVRLMACWVLIKAGEKDVGRKGILDLLTGNSYAILTVLNLIDWMGDDISVYRSAIESLNKLKGDEAKMRTYLLVGNGK